MTPYDSTSPTLTMAPFAPPPVPTDVRLFRVADDLWRVIDKRGRAVGHLQASPHPLGLRYRARRFHVATGRFRDLGDFWSAADAVDCLRAA